MTDKDKRLKKLEIALELSEHAFKFCCMQLDRVANVLKDLRDSELGINQPKTHDEIHAQMTKDFGTKPLSEFYANGSLATMNFTSIEELKQKINDETCRLLMKND